MMGEIKMRDKILVVGSGLMGSGIGAMSALAGNPTVLLDVDEERTARGLRAALQCVSLRVENGLHSKEDGERARALLSTSTDVEQSAVSARLVIEAIVERLDAKQEMFAKLDALLPPEVPICSNTSGLQITKIAEKCVHPQRTVATHFWLPAHLVPLVEVVMGEKTDRNVAEQVYAELKTWKKAPVLVTRDLPGQLANRIFQAIIRESIAIVASGLASAEDVDTAISCGMAMRFPEWGPLQHLDAIGLELGLSVQDSVLPDICHETKANEYLRRMVENGETGAASGKGFYDYAVRDIELNKKKRDAFIMEAVKIKEKIDQMQL